MSGSCYSSEVEQILADIGLQNHQHLPEVWKVGIASAAGCSLVLAILAMLRGLGPLITDGA